MTTIQTLTFKEKEQVEIDKCLDILYKINLKI